MDGSIYYAHNGGILVPVHKEKALLSRMSLLLRITLAACVVTVFACIFTSWMVLDLHQQFSRASNEEKHGIRDDDVIEEKSSYGQLDLGVDVKITGNMRNVRAAEQFAENGFMNDGVTGKKGRKNKKKKGRKGSTTDIFAAAHYTFCEDDDCVKNKFGNKPGPEQRVRCKQVVEWKGTICDNYTYINSEGQSYLPLITPAPWMKTSMKQFSIFNTSQDGIFKATRTGLYLLYAHVLLYDVNETQVIAINHNSSDGFYLRNSLTCVESKENAPSGFNAHIPTYKTCSVTGVIYIRSQELVTVVVKNRNTNIDIASDATYFGGLFFNMETYNKQFSEDSPKSGRQNKKQKKNSKGNKRSKNLS